MQTGPALKVFVLALLMLGGHVLAGSALTGLRGKTFDLYQHILPAPPDMSDIVLVGIDDAALAREGRWPWPREKIARLVDAIAEAEPSAFGIDILFSEAGDPAGDAALRTAIAHARPVLAMSLSERSETISPSQIAGWSVIGNISERVGKRLPVFPGLLASREEFTAVAGGLGIVRSIPDIDGITRSVPMVWAVSDEAGLTFWPSMSLELARLATDAPSYALRLSDAGYDAVKFGNHIVPLTAGGAIWLSDSTHVPRHVGALDVLYGNAGSSLSGKIVILSLTATGLDSFHTTPLVTTRPGAEIHALLTGQALGGPFPYEPTSARGTERILFLLIAAILCLSLRFLAGKKILLVAAMLILLALPFGLGLAAYAYKGQLYDSIQPTIGLAILAGVGSYFLYQAEEARRERISGQFSRYLSPKVVETLIRSESDITRTAERRVVTVMFMDMRDFTATSERLEPEAVVATINRFLTIASEEIFATDGTIDKFMGDAVMAFWNAPLDQPDHVRRARDCVDAILSRIAMENEERAAYGFDAIRLGAGIETGPCSVGNFGSDIRYNYTIIGSAANMAARLETATKTAGIPVLAGPGFAKLAPDLVTPAGSFALHGFSALVPGFAVKLSNGQPPNPANETL